jgi:hypothetical protein
MFWFANHLDATSLLTLRAALGATASLAQPPAPPTRPARTPLIPLNFTCGYLRKRRTSTARARTHRF